jgi:hypothetical protein
LAGAAAAGVDVVSVDEEDEVLVEEAGAVADLSVDSPFVASFPAPAPDLA